MNVFAVFVVGMTDGGIAMTTRPDGKVGLPGGKVDAGEDIATAALREASEEGWLFASINPVPFYSQNVDGKTVVWLKGVVGHKLADYKEAYRGIRPFVGTFADFANSGFGNDNAAKAFQTQNQ